MLPWRSDDDSGFVDVSVRASWETWPRSSEVCLPRQDERRKSYLPRASDPGGRSSRPKPQQHEKEIKKKKGLSGANSRLATAYHFAPDGFPCFFFLSFARR